MLAIFINILIKKDIFDSLMPSLSGLKLILSRIPRVLVYVLIPILFNIGEETDSFLLAWAIVTFTVNLLAFTVETYAIKEESTNATVFVVILPIVYLTTVVLALLASDQTRDVVLLTLPYLTLAIFTSVYVGGFNKQQKYNLNLMSGILYLTAVPIALILALTSPLSPTLSLLIALTFPEAIRFLFVVYKGRLDNVTFKALSINPILLIAGVSIIGLTHLGEKALVAQFTLAGELTIWIYALGVIGLASGLINYSRAVRIMNGEVQSLSWLKVVRKGIAIWLSIVFLMILTVAIVNVYSLDTLEIGPLAITINGLSVIRIIGLIAVIGIVIPVRHLQNYYLTSFVKISESYKSFLILNITFPLIRLPLLYLALTSSYGLKGLTQAGVVIICTDIVYLFVTRWFFQKSTT